MMRWVASFSQVLALRRVWDGLERVGTVRGIGGLVVVLREERVCW
jgi:hypothetical protein